MGNKIQWYLEKQVIYNALSGNITIESVAKGSNVIQEMIAPLDAPVDIIFNASEVTVSPTHIGKLSSVTQSLFESDKIGYIIVITTNPIQRFIGNLILQVFHKQSKIVGSLEEAIRSLKVLNPSLPDLANEVPNIDIIKVD